MPYRIICFVEVYKTSIQFFTGFLKCLLINECFQTKDMITGSVTLSKGNLRDMYEFFLFYTLRQVYYFKQFVSILHKQLNTHTGRKLSGLDESPFLCTGVINPLNQIFRTHPAVRIKFSSITEECLIIS